MIRLISLSAALALLPLSSALAQDAPKTDVATAEARLEAAAEAFEARMETYGERAEAISENAALNETQRSAAISALWAEYQPAVTAFTEVAAREAGAIAQAALADIDMDALVEDALKEADMKGAMAMAKGITTNSAWVQDDPEQRETYGLIADYALTQASDAVADAYADHDDDDHDHAEAPEAPEAPEPPEAPEL